MKSSFVTTSLVVVPLLGLVPDSARAALLSLDDVMQATTSEIASVRYEARDQLRLLLTALPVEERKDTIDALLRDFRKPDYRRQLAVATALSKLPQPWEARNHDPQLKMLYETFLKTKDLTLQRAIDDALANARGLYLDAIRDYNQNVTDVERVTQKFNRMSDEFPRSRYAANAAFYLGQYYTRVGRILQKPEEFVPKSDAAFDLYIARAAKKQFTNTDFNAAAFYFRALNRVLVRDDAGAIQQLDKQKPGAQERIYVYQFFFNRKARPVDRFFPAQRLVLTTRDFIKQNPNGLPDKQEDLANSALKIVPSLAR